MTAKGLTLLFVLYGGPSIAALLFLMLGFLMARTRAEVILASSVAGVLTVIHIGELYWLWDLRRVWGGGDEDPLAVAGVGLALLAALLNYLFVSQRLRRVSTG